MADAEEREAQRLASEALEAMLKRVQRKLNQFSALEEALVKEKAHAEVIYPVPVHHEECSMHGRQTSACSLCKERAHAKVSNPVPFLMKNVACMQGKSMHFGMIIDLQRRRMLRCVAPSLS